MTTLLFILVLLVLVLVHEFGHFIIAKVAGIRVEEFGVGLPPRVFGRTWRGTLWSINWIPLGGFVRIFGEDDTGEVTPDSFNSKPLLVRIGVVVAGIVCNILLAYFFVAFALLSGLRVPTDVFPNTPHQELRLIITGVVDNSVAANASVLVGAQIISLSSDNGLIEPTSPEVVQKFVAENKDREIVLRVNVAPDYKEEQSYSLTPTPLLGIEMAEVGLVKLSLLDAFIFALPHTFELTSSTLTGLIDLAVRALQGESTLQYLSGPVGIAGVIGEASHLGLGPLLYIIALISLSLAVINLVPLPALDGGKILFMLIEHFRKRPLPKSFVQITQVLSFALLIIFLIFITYHDIYIKNAI